VIATLLLIFLAPISFAKKAAIVTPENIIRDGIEYAVDVNPLVCKDEEKSVCHEEILVSAKRKVNGEEVWKTMIVQVNFASSKETDVQLILPTAMRLVGKHQLIITTEDQNRFILNAKTGDMIRPSKTSLLESRASE
jgi:hypothetical protein